MHWEMLRTRFIKVRMRAMITLIKFIKAQKKNTVEKKNIKFYHFQICSLLVHIKGKQWVSQSRAEWLHAVQERHHETSDTRGTKWRPTTADQERQTGRHQAHDPSVASRRDNQPSPQKRYRPSPATETIPSEPQYEEI